MFIFMLKQAFVAVKMYKKNNNSMKKRVFWGDIQ